MRRSEVVYLAAVFGFALLFAGLTLGHVRDAFWRGAAAGSPGAGAAGTPRDIDLELIRRLIQERRLSDREAEFYRRLLPAGLGQPPATDKR